MGATIAAQSALVVGVALVLARCFRAKPGIPVLRRAAVLCRSCQTDCTGGPPTCRLGANKAFPGAGAHPNGEARKIGTPTARKVPNRPKRAFGNAELTSLKRELTEALERQKASDILNGINGSKIELQPVLDTVAHYRNSSERVS